MRLVPMMFGGVQWRHNPREISFSCDRQVNELVAPFDSASIQETGRRNMVIRGEGELFGEDCLEQFERLLRLFKAGGQGVLAIDGISPVYAVFESVKLVGAPRPDVLTYSFVFREVMQSKLDSKPVTHKAENGENLWDISYKFGIEIDKLVGLNPQLKRPDEVEEGEVIRLA